MTSTRPENEPLALFRRWFAEARRAGIELPEAMALATADATGKPSVRMVLLKDVSARGFTFFTDGRSIKARELIANPRAALAFYWHEIEKQVRIAGDVEEVDAAAADAYWATRPLGSRIAASVSTQSAPLASRAELLAAWRRLERRVGSGRARGRDRQPESEAIPRPPRWTGYRVIPSEIEFWRRGEFRLHHRVLYVRRRRGWTRTLLQP